MKCLVTRSGFEYWIPEEKVSSVVQAIQISGIKFVEVAGDYIATSDIVGFVSEQQIYNKAQKKRGFIQLGKKGEWVDKKDSTQNFREPYIPFDFDSKLIEAKKD